jgi:hypothetical protein
MHDCGHNTVRSDGGGIPVPVTDLDTWREKNSVTNIQAMKIDIEGWEYPALQGARRLLSEERPVIVSEAAVERFPAGSVHEKDDLLGFLQRLDYKITWLQDVCSPTVLAQPR